MASRFANLDTVACSEKERWPRRGGKRRTFEHRATTSVRPAGQWTRACLTW